MEPLPQYLVNALDEIVIKEGFSEYKYEISPGSKAEIVRVTVEGVRLGKPDQLKLIFKYPPQNVARQETFGINVAFEREVQAYNEILPEYEKFQLGKGLTRDGPGWWSFPKCYYAVYNEERSEMAIVMEDLCARGLFMAEAKTPSDYQQTKIVMEELGKFHAVSFALKSQCHRFHQKYEQLRDCQVKSMNNPMLRSFFDKNFIRCNNLLTSDEHQPWLKKLEEFRKNLWPEFIKLTSAEIAEPYAILVNSDCWVNNAMFRYSKDGNTVEETSLIDWQFISYASPVLDIIIYIFCSTDKPMRDLHYKELLKCYHNEFSKLLEILGDDPNILFPYSALEEQLQKVGKYGLGISMFTIPVLTAEKDTDLNDLAENLVNNPNSDQDHVEFSDESEQKYRSRMMGNVIDAFEYGYI